MEILSATGAHSTGTGKSLASWSSFTRSAMEIKELSAICSCSAVGPPFLLARFSLSIIWFCFMCYKIISELYLYASSRIEHTSNKVYFVHPATIMPGLFVPSFLIVILTNQHLFKPSMAPHNSRH
ncbi:hypothetical protein BX666DRAFT_1944744 [Dichotomocladium elegans]|nr:hypothetical protein BX666DRAFT_1944744 [Dichotomocladium elegans]